MAHSFFDAHSPSLLPVASHLIRAMEVATENAAGRQPSEHPPCLTLCSLPDEILLQIAIHLGGHNALPSLSRANKYLHAITNEAMARNFIVHPCHLKHAIEWLVKHPALIGCVKSVDLVFSYRRCPSKCDNSGEVDFSHEVAGLLYKFIPASNQQILARAYSRKGKRIVNPIWTRHLQHFMDVLGLLCPNLDTLDIQMPAASHYDRKPTVVPNGLNHQLPMVNTDCVPVPPIQGVAFEVLRNRLRSLTIAPHDTWAGPAKSETLDTQMHVTFRSIGRDYITLQGFNRLQYLDITMEALGVPSSLHFQGLDGKPITRATLTHRHQTLDDPDRVSFGLPAKVLPLSLITIRFRRCNRFTFSYLVVIWRMARLESKLKNIKFFLDVSPREIILMCSQESRNTPTLYFGLLEALRRMGLSVTFYATEDEKPVNMQFELAQLLLMVPSAAAIIALAGRQYSEINTAALERRESSRAEHKLFMKHALSHFELFDRPTFDARYWTKAAFFHGLKNTKSPLRKRRRDKFFDLEHYEFFFFPAREPLKTQPPVEEVSFLGKVFAHRPLVSKTVAEDKVSLERHRGQKKSDPEKPKGKKQSRDVKTANDRDTKKVSKPEDAQCRSSQSICFKDEPQAIVVTSDSFDGAAWEGMKWQEYIRPHVDTQHEP
ncbi:hypothetical protein BDU57DRAFT_495994 [Ampelomyces quisqualis]|uniref:F-box domain-containing protein n=1 Tax=Ampelomyces quisqualis TaxID=50730 RepID=A0A6A5QKL0_AMPQU|nr:hypothetical protein BDU57DRAFT_495994 [Ampelomyces quisqualis]